MPKYLFAFPVHNAVFESADLSYKLVDVRLASKVSLSKEILYLNEEKSKFKENQIFAVVVVCGSASHAKELAYNKCSFAIDIFKICSDLYHNDFFNPKKWQFDINNDYFTQGDSCFFYKELDSSTPETIHANYHVNRYNTCIDSKVLESVTKWNISDFKSLYSVFYSADGGKIHQVLKRACHIYSQSFSINHLYERVVMLCTVLDTLATNEREGKVPQLKKYLPALVLKCERLTERLKGFIEQIYDIRSAYIHNAEELNITESEVDKLEKIVYRTILQIARNSCKYKSTKEICVAIDNGSFVPIMDNLPDIYI